MPAGRQFRLGGLVKAGSTVRAPDGLAVSFTVTDGLAEMPVRYVGILPDLFREGQGVIARGALDGSGTFEASEVLAKHDENYMPPEVADALQKTGHPSAPGRQPADG
jgi:cytochrome c-type biogenesis protein CcmE